MVLDFGWIIPKDLSYREEVEDYYRFSQEDKILGLSDGASESYDSKTWARILVDQYLGSPRLSEDWLSHAIRQYKDSYDFDAMSWSQQSAYERGSYATLLGVEYNETRDEVDVISIGDCIAVLLESGRLVDVFRYTRYTEFSQRPTLLCSRLSGNEFFFESGFFIHNVRTWKLSKLKRPEILCMTDAVGAWALRRSEYDAEIWNILLSIESEREFEDLVLEERSAKRMKVDDVTLVKLSFNNEVQYALPLT